MTRIIYHEGKPYVTEDWPVKPECNVPLWDENSRIDGEECRESINCPCHQYESALASLVPVVEEDQEIVEDLIAKKHFDGNLLWKIQDHTPYEIDVELELLEGDIEFHFANGEHYTDRTRFYRLKENK